jgi:hypothetical protein
VDKVSIAYGNHNAFDDDFAAQKTRPAAAAARTALATATGVTMSPTPAAAGTVTRAQTATATAVTRTTAAAGFVTDLGTATLTVTPTTTAVPQAITDTASASLTITPTTTAALGAVTKTQTATGVTLTPAVAATPQLMTKTQAATGVTVTRTTAASGEAYTTKFLMPDALLVQTGVTGVVANIQDSPTSPDGSYLTPSGGAINVRMSFEDNAQDMRTNSGDQIIRVRVAKV